MSNNFDVVFFALKRRVEVAAFRIHDGVVGGVFDVICALFGIITSSGAVCTRGGVAVSRLRPIMNLLDVAIIIFHSLDIKESTQVLEVYQSSRGDTCK